MNLLKLIIPQLPDAADPYWLHATLGKATVVKLWETMAIDQFWKGAITACVLLLVINAIVEKLRSPRQ